MGIILTNKNETIKRSKELKMCPYFKIENFTYYFKWKEYSQPEDPNFLCNVE